MKLALVSTYNVECGISTYSEHLSEHFEVGSCEVFANKLSVFTDTQGCLKHPIKRCWERTGDFKELTAELLKSDCDVVHFQHEFGLFQNNGAFVQMLKELRTYRKAVVITFHTIFNEAHLNAPIHQMAPYVNMFICHSEGGKSILATANSMIIPHGSVVCKAKPRAESRKHLNIPDDKIVVLSMGFITPTKGAMDTISAVYRLRYDFSNLYFLLVGMPIVVANNYANMEYCLKLFKRTQMLNLFDTVHIYPKFVSERDIDFYAGATDVVVENYYQTHFSTSGMGHLVMSYGLPSVSSKANILEDLNTSRSLKFDIGNIEQMTNNLRMLIRSEELRKRLSENCLKYADETSWPRIAKRHWEVYQSVCGSI